MLRTFIIDTDTASDDAVALIMALCHPDVNVIGITTVSGNVSLAQATRNALYTAQMCGRADVPVYPGAARPLMRPTAHAEWFHGQDGMGDQNYPAPERQPEAKHAVDALIELISANPGIVLVTLGPLTNIALAISRAPQIISNVSRCVIMGGAACSIGNVIPAAEYNMWCDPEAARIVFRSGLPIEMVGWDVTRGDANLFTHEIEALRSLGTPLSKFAMDCNTRALDASHQQSGDAGLNLPDPVAMAVALDPSIVKRKSTHYVDVEVQSELTRGQTVIDVFNLATDPRNRDTWAVVIKRPPTVSVCWEIDIHRWKTMLSEALK